MSSAVRPLSPHLQVYKPQLTSVMSIVHRITGIVLSIGLLFLLYWLAALAGGESTYAQAQALLGSWFGRVVLFGFTVALFYHLCNGIRHLFWDVGYGFELPVAYASGKIVLVATAVLTLLTWIVAFAMNAS
ncbi:MAG: succinate dehydrogenase, cytochrome b556 subunit [Gammaproteobacteria bacterium]